MTSWAAWLPNWVANTRSNGVGTPPRCTWPSTVARTSLRSRGCSCSRKACATPPRRTGSGLSAITQTSAILVSPAAIIAAIIIATGSNDDPVSP